MELTVPALAVRASFVAAIREFQAEGRYAQLDAERLAAPAVFASYLAAIAADALPDTPRSADRVPQTTLWWIDGEEYLGRLSIRHRLTPALRREGGHIGYDVRPSARRRGHATAMLRAALPLAAALGIERALLTCDADNVASRRVIEANGGRRTRSYDDGKLRYWVPTVRR
jgi:predicted acetyltransferase